MEGHMREVIESEEQRFNTRELGELRDIVGELEQRVIGDNLTENHQEQQNDLRQLWFELVRLSSKICNVELALLAIAKLQFTQLALTVKSSLQSDDTMLGEFIALDHIRDFFQLKNQNQTYSSANHDFFYCQRLIEFYTNKCDWFEAFKCADENLQGDDAHLINQLVYHNMAVYQEIDENPPEALVYLSKLVSSNGFAMIRLLLKLHQDLAYPEIRKFFSSTRKSDSIVAWAKYAMSCDKTEDVFELLERPDVVVLYVKYNFRRNRSLVESRIFDKLPEKMLICVKDDDHSWWMNRRNVDYLISVTRSLDPSLRDALSEMSSQYEQYGQLARACSLFLCFNQTEKFLSAVQSRDLKIKSTSIPCYKLGLASKYGSPGELLYSLYNYLRSQTTSHISEALEGEDESDYLESNEPSLEPLFGACLKLGLVDEFLQVLAMNPFTMNNNKNILDAIEFLRNIISDHKHSPRSLDQVDPIIHRGTLDKLYKSIQDTSQTLSTNVMTIVILSTTIFLLKLNTTIQLKPQATTDTTTITMAENFNEQQVLLDNCVEILETLFEKLIEFLRGLNFNASDDLINATNSLISALKDKIETLAESDIIRESFKDLIEQIASRCMIESQYRSAAMLYSQIEDNVNAIKSLMRMGDVDVVINYSLLVRDITVNRLTINFLRHLQVDGAILKDFISKSKL